jgi:hypothetical protein
MWHIDQISTAHENIKIIKNDAIYKVLIITVIKNSKKQIIYILKIIIIKKKVCLLNKIIYIINNKSLTLFLSLENLISFVHVKNFQNLDWENLALDPKKVCHP